MTTLSVRPLQYLHRVLLFSCKCVRMCVIFIQTFSFNSIDLTLGTNLDIDKTSFKGQVMVNWYRWGVVEGVIAALTHNYNYEDKVENDTQGPDKRLLYYHLCNGQTKTFQDNPSISVMKRVFCSSIFFFYHSQFWRHGWKTSTKTVRLEKLKGFL